MAVFGKITGICIAPAAGDPMRSVQSVEALKGLGLSGDRYAKTEGSYNKKAPGTRQVSLINGIFLLDSGFTLEHTRRNISVHGVELMWLIGREFQIGTAVFKGIKYCDPCDRPSKLSGIRGFASIFSDRGGLIAEVITEGIIYKGCDIVPPPKGY